MQLLSRTAAAFTFTCERLAREYRKLYFWTFTFKSVPLNDEEAMEEWNMLNRRLQYHFEWIRGVRVCELHKSHGIHFHAIVNGRIPIRRLQEIIVGRRHLTGHNRYLDFGRMSVTRCDTGTIGYMAKYLCKQYRADNNFGHRRRWGTIGGFNPCRCIDVEYVSPWHKNKYHAFGRARIDYATCLMLSHYTTLWGAWHDWPVEYKMRLVNFSIRTKENADRESWKHKPMNQRIDIHYAAWSGHLEMCSQCRYGHEICKRGLQLWEQSIFGKWEFAEAPEIVTPCNKNTQVNSSVEELASEASDLDEAPQEKNFYPKTVSTFWTQSKNRTQAGLQPEKEKGKRIYILLPFNELHKESETLNCPF